MQQSLPLHSLPFVTLTPSGAVARALRSSSTLLGEVAILLGVLVAMPLVGFLFFTILLLGPAVFIYALVLASFRLARERLSVNRARRATAVESPSTRAALRLAPSGAA